MKIKLFFFFLWRYLIRKMATKKKIISIFSSLSFLPSLLTTRAFFGKVPEAEAEELSRLYSAAPFRPTEVVHVNGHVSMLFVNRRRERSAARRKGKSTIWTL